MNIRRKIAVVLALQAGVLTVRAAFDPLGYGAAAKGLGGAYVALAEDGSAAYWNPAGLARVEDSQFTASLEDLYGLGLLRYATAGYTQPRVGKGVISAHLLHLDTAGEADFVNYAESTYLVAYGRQVCCQSLSVGAGLRYYSATSDDTTGTGLGFDLGVLFRPWDGRVRLAAAWQDLNRPRIDWETGTRDRLPYTVRAGAALRLARGADVAAQYDKRYGEGAAWRFGVAQRLWRDTVSVRAGLHRTRGQGEWGAAFGGGLRFKKIEFDYAWDTQDSLGDAQTFSITVRFGP